MNWKSGLLVSLFLGKLLLLNTSGQSASFPPDAKTGYEVIFGDSYRNALIFLAQHPGIRDSLLAHNIQPGFALSVVFPELIRYSVIRDKIEVSGLLALYVNYGPSYANFSVGRFQMKPLFAEQLEKDQVCFFKKKSRPENEDKTGRYNRVLRLTSIQGQTAYLISFIKIMDYKYRNRIWRSAEQKVRFYATAYNCGYTSPEKEIEKKMYERLFYTTFFPQQQVFNYGAIAADFYKRGYFDNK